MRSYVNADVSHEANEARLKIHMEATTAAQVLRLLLTSACSTLSYGGQHISITVAISVWHSSQLLQLQLVWRNGQTIADVLLMDKVDTELSYQAKVAAGTMNGFLGSLKDLDFHVSSYRHISKATSAVG